MKYPAIIVFTIALGLAILFLYDPSSDPGKGVQTLVVGSRLWSHPAEQEFVRNSILASFEQAHGCVVKLTLADDAKLLQQVQVQRDTGNQTTDVVVVYGPQMRRWIEDNLVEDLDNQLKTWNERSFAEGFRALTSKDGKRYFLPVAADDYLLLVNKLAMEHLPEGASIKTLSWQQLADWALAIAKAEGEGKMAFTAAAQKMLIYQVSAVVLSYGGGFPDVASEGALAAWKLLKSMKPALCKATTTFDTVIPPLKRGEAWIAISHNARIGEVYAMAPDRYVIAPVPLGPAGRGSVAGVSGLGLVKGSAKSELALAFMKYLTQPEIQLQLSKGTGGFIPAVTEAQALLGDAPEDAVIRESLKVLKQGKLAFIPAVNDWGSVKKIYDEAFAKIVLGDTEADPAYLDGAQEKINALLKL
ncbi:MAG: extracellular solute-binding protein [Planctomycetes bacterium]|nr:extracellular solute-binding protein [Planctomycetota bacterium]